MYYAYGYGGRLSKVSDITAHASDPDNSGNVIMANNFSYAPTGGLASETWGNTAVHTVDYNYAQQPKQAKLSLTSGGVTTVLQQYDYSYGSFNTSSGAVDPATNNGQIGKIKGSINGTAQWNQGFSYDELGRLSNVVEHQSDSMTTQTYSQDFTYDRWGNKRQSVNTTLGLPAVADTDYDTTNNNNRFTSAVATYDAMGNITTDSKFRSPNPTYAYDANGRQKTASNGTGSGRYTESQTYDAAGLRVQTSVTISGTTTYRTMVYDIFGHNIADYSGSTGATLERENVYRGGLLATYEAGSNSLKYILQDIQGTSRASMNNSGSSSSVSVRHDYLPFGEEISSSLRGSGQGYGASDSNRQRYGLTERDDTTALDHTWYRKYESLAGRWTTPDALAGGISDPQSLNRFSYSENDPVNSVDPDGLCVFNINITSSSEGQLKEVQDTISAIFKSGRHDVVFGKPKEANGGSFNLNIVNEFPPNVLAAMDDKHRNDPETFGFTFPSTINGYVDTGRIRGATEQYEPPHYAYSGTKWGRVGAHEAIQHGFLKGTVEGRVEDITRPAYDEDLVRRNTDRFNIDPATAAALAKLCEPKKATANATVTSAGAGLAGGGALMGGFGGGTLGSLIAAWSFASWLRTIQVGHGSLTGIKDISEEEWKRKS
jgi:RHS repeat-associated protein